MLQTQPARKKALKNAIKALVGKESSAGRSLSVLPNDVFITSYPKSGNTWTRFLTANLLWADDSTDFINIEQRVPDIYKHGDTELLSFDQPRYLKSHEYFDPRYPKVVYIVRDPRSILVSYYNYEMRWATRFGPETSYYDFAKVFVSGELNAFGSWQQNVLSWLGVYRNNPERLCYIRYEDLLSNGQETLTRVSSFLGLDRSEAQIAHALKMSSFNRMKALEKASDQDDKHWESAPKNKSIPFMRSGKSSEWKQVLNEKTLTLIEDSCGALIEELGYAL